VKSTEFQQTSCKVTRTLRKCLCVFGGGKRRGVRRCWWRGGGGYWLLGVCGGFGRVWVGFVGVWGVGVGGFK